MRAFVYYNVYQCCIWISVFVVTFHDRHDTIICIASLRGSFLMKPIGQSGQWTHGDQPLIGWSTLNVPFVHRPTMYMNKGSSGSMNYRGWERGTETSIVQVRFMDSLGCHVYWQERSKNHLTLDKEIGEKSLFPLSIFVFIYFILSMLVDLFTSFSSISVSSIQFSHFSISA